MLIQENPVSKVRLSLINLGNTNLELVAPLSENTADFQISQAAWAGHSSYLPAGGGYRTSAEGT